MYFDLTCIDKLLGGEEEYIKSLPDFQGHIGTLKCQNFGFFAFSFKTVD